MPRISRVVIPGLPHHVVQRGNRRQQVFFTDDDRRLYLDLLVSAARNSSFRILAYCMMTNHVHLIIVPETADSLSIGLADVHSTYSRLVNRRQGWTGCLFQGPFRSCVMDDRQLVAAVRYVERNPVRAGIVARAVDYEWSSCQARVEGKVDPVLDRRFLSECNRNWGEYLGGNEPDDWLTSIREHTSTGRPLGETEFVLRLEKSLARPLMRRKPGRPKSSDTGPSRRRTASAGARE